MGFVAAEAQVRTIPVYVVAAVCCVATAYLADRMRHRYGYAIFGVLVASVGYALLLAQQHVGVGVRYFALFMIMSGGFATQPITMGWLSNLVSGHYKRATATAMQIGLGSTGGITASVMFFEWEAPLYRTGLGFSLGMMWVCATGCTAMFFYALWENRKRDRGERGYRLQEPDADNLGDDHPNWRYTT